MTEISQPLQALGEAQHWKEVFFYLRICGTISQLLLKKMVQVVLYWWKNMKFWIWLNPATIKSWKNVLFYWFIIKLRGVVVQYQGCWNKELWIKFIEVHKILLVLFFSINNSAQRHPSSECQKHYYLISLLLEPKNKRYLLDLLLFTLL